MTKIKNRESNANSSIKVWTEEQCEEYLYGIHDFDYIAGYTNGGAPYGISLLIYLQV